jgi:hypothetical protein
MKRAVNERLAADPIGKDHRRRSGRTDADDSVP